MTLEDGIASRDYLYGRLLAIADHLEHVALRYAGESRETMAMKLMTRFAAHPCSTWRSIELSLVPYKARIESRAAGYLVRLNDQVSEICSKFEYADFVDDSALAGEFLLGFYCQRAELRRKKEDNVEDTNKE